MSSKNKNTGLAKSTRPKMTKVNALICYNFSVDELAGKSQELAHKSIELQQLKKDKAQVVSEFTSKEKACEAEIGTLSQKISNRYEHRKMDVMMHKDFDNGVKRYYDIQSGRELMVEKLTADDYQLDLEEQEAASKK